jgi:hypothetical protein
MSDILDKTPIEQRTYINRFELDWMKNNIDFIKALIESHPSSLISTTSQLQVGGLVYACKYLDDEGRVRVANALANTLVEDAKERIPHLEYLLNDAISWDWLNPAGWLIRRDKEELMEFIAQENAMAEQGIRKHINEKTYVNWKVTELIDLLKEDGVTEASDHTDIIYHIFKECDYEHYGSTGDNTKEAKLLEANRVSQYKETVRKRIHNIKTSPYPHQPTHFTIWKKKTPEPY